MKCVRKGAEIVRVTNSKAKRLVTEGWDYCPRSDWKLEVRDRQEGSRKDEIEAVKDEQQGTPKQSVDDMIRRTKWQNVKSAKDRRN